MAFQSLSLPSLDWQSLSISDGVGILQALIAFVSVVLLYKTIRLHKKANDQQAKSTLQQEHLLEMEMKAKRAGYLPRIEIRVLSLSNNHKYRAGSYEPIGTSYKLSVRIIVKEKAFTNLDIKVSGAPDGLFQEIKALNLNYAIYREGDNKIFDVVNYDTSNLNEIIKDLDKFEIIFTLRYEDLIGNKYIHPVIYDAKSDRDMVLPFSIDSDNET